MVEKADMDWRRVNQLAKWVGLGVIDTKQLAREAEQWPDADEIAALAAEAHSVLDRLDDALNHYLES